MRIIVVGLGHVGLPIAIMLARRHIVIGVDIDKHKIKQINDRQSYLSDPYVEQYLQNEILNLVALESDYCVYKDAELIIIAVPTNYNDDSKNLDTSIIESIMKSIKEVNPNAIIVIKSTVPIGFSVKVKLKFNLPYVLFSPEFLREGHELYDNLYPSRIVVGICDEDCGCYDITQCVRKYIEILKECSVSEKMDILVTGMSEAEAIKLFSNAYLALRVTFFNELDMYAEEKNLNPKDIINGVCLDNRIGAYYNNPSFGYGGYCLPKDANQLLSSYNGIDNRIIRATVESNAVRLHYIIDKIFSRNPHIIGLFRLTTKTQSASIRDSIMSRLLSQIKNKEAKIVIYEPIIDEDMYNDCEIIRNINIFKERADIIVANRMYKDLNDVSEKVYTRDIFFRD
jgi:UDPglucose 6-dehydrogenase